MIDSPALNTRTPRQALVVARRSDTSIPSRKGGLPLCIPRRSLLARPFPVTLLFHPSNSV